MNITSIRNSSIPAQRPQDRPAAQDGPGKDPGAQASRAVKKTEAAQGIPAGGQAVLSDAEQRFFEDMYPGAVSELRTSPSYARSGQQPDHRTGTLLDRKG
jgi:hypothetical protein